MAGLSLTLPFAFYYLVLIQDPMGLLEVKNNSGQLEGCVMLLLHAYAVSWRRSAKRRSEVSYCRSAVPGCSRPVIQHWICISRRVHGRLRLLFDMD